MSKHTLLIVVVAIAVVGYLWWRKNKAGAAPAGAM
jgi:membrane protein DedA with SNARE-associated domain